MKPRNEFEAAEHAAVEEICLLYGDEKVSLAGEEEMLTICINRRFAKLRATYWALSDLAVLETEANKYIEKFHETQNERYREKALACHGKIVKLLSDCLVIDAIKDRRGGVRNQQQGKDGEREFQINGNKYYGWFRVEYDGLASFSIQWTDGHNHDYVDLDHQGVDGYDHKKHGEQVAADITRALYEWLVYKEDLEAIEVRLNAALDNARCPECGCGDVNDAESNECGCEALVCSIERPETLAEAYVRVCKELAAYKADHQRHNEFLTWAQSYVSDHPSLCRWGDRLDLGIKETLLQRDQELAELSDVRSKLARIIALTRFMQKYEDRKRAGHEIPLIHTEAYNINSGELTRLMHDHDVIAAVAEAAGKPQTVDVETTEDETPIWGECLYCGEAVELPAKYCCEEHEEGRRIE